MKDMFRNNELCFGVDKHLFDIKGEKHDYYTVKYVSGNSKTG